MILNQAGNDKLFITEILNDMHRQGISTSNGFKYGCLLKDWAKELRSKANFPASRLRRIHTAEVGRHCW